MAPARDALNRMSSRSIVRGATTLASETYTYDDMDRLWKVNRTDTSDDTFTYYLDGELNTANLAGPNGSNTTYNLDRAGNRTSIVDGGVNKDYVNDAMNQYTTGNGLAVTNGTEHQITSHDGITYTYYNDGRLKSATNGSSSIAYYYDALGRLARRVIDGIDILNVYDGQRCLLEYYDATHTFAWNVYGKGIDEILERGAAATNGQWNWTFYTQDHEGSVTHLTSTTGAVIEKYQYDAFGAPVILNGSGARITASFYNNPIMFTGRQAGISWGVYLGYYEYRARAYHPKLGRFTSEDPTLYDGGDYNLFRYCHDDPVDMTDPMGLQDAAKSVPWEFDHHRRGWTKQAAHEMFSYGALTVTADRVDAERRLIIRTGIQATKMAEAAQGNGEVPYSVATRRYEDSDNVVFGDPVPGVRASIRGGYRESIDTSPDKFAYFRANPTAFSDKWGVFVVGHTHPVGRSQPPAFSEADRALQRGLLKSHGRAVPLFKNSATWPGRVYDERSLGPSGWQVMHYFEDGTVQSGPVRD